MARRTYAREFKDSAARLVTEQGYRLNQAAQSLGVTPASLRAWIKPLPPASGASSDDPTTLKAEIAR